MNAMKRIVCILLSLLVWVTGWGVDREMALKVARTVLGPETKGNGYVLIQEGPYFVFGRESGGYVIVSGYEAGHPVLAYSHSDIFRPESLPEAMRTLLDGYGRMLDEARNSGLQPDDATRAEWAAYLSGTVADPSEGVLLETAFWGQGAPYNMFCPLVGGQHCLTGCVNTSTATVMRYFKWPERGRGELPGGITLGHVYDWDSMPLTNLNEYTTAHQREEVARLMYELGMMNGSKYGLDATLASLNVERLVYHYDYDPHIRIVWRETVSSDLAWEEMIKTELLSARPVLYAARISETERHQFVVDGYQGRFFHVNMGWGGYSNTYMVVTPIDGGSSSFLKDLYQEHQMYIGIQPNRGEAAMGVSCVSIWISDFTYETGVPFFAYADLASNTPEEQSLDVAFALISGDGYIEEIISEPQKATLSGWDWYFPGNKCTITSALEKDQRIGLCYRNDAGVWEVVPAGEGVYYPMSHEQSLRSLCQLSYMKNLPAAPDCEQLSLRLPMDCRVEVYDEAQESSDLSIDNSTSSWEIKHRRDAPSRTVVVKLRDLTQSVQFRLVL